METAYYDLSARMHWFGEVTSSILFLSSKIHFQVTLKNKCCWQWMQRHSRAPSLSTGISTRLARGSGAPVAPFPEFGRDGEHCPIIQQIVTGAGESQNLEEGSGTGSPSTRRLGPGVCRLQRHCPWFWTQQGVSLGSWGWRELRPLISVRRKEMTCQAWLWTWSSVHHHFVSSHQDQYCQYLYTLLV